MEVYRNVNGERELVEVSPDDADLLTFALKQRAEIKATEDVVKEGIKGLNDTVAAVLDVYQATGIYDPDVGSYARQEGSRSSIDRQTLLQEMVAAQIPLEKALTIVEKATKVSTYTSFVFRKPKEKN